MNRSLLALLPALLACAPEQPSETDGCDSIADCPLDEVCDRELGECIPEPEDRFLGRFHCTVGSKNQSPEALELSEITGRIGTDRWALPISICNINTASELMVLGFSSPFSGSNLRVWLDASPLTAKRTLGPVVDLRVDSASIEDYETFTAYGHSRVGMVEFSRVPAVGLEVDGYLDVAMYPAVREDALPGVPCPRGLADCGDKTLEAGGIVFCTNLSNGPMCTSACSANGDCSVGDGVCVQGFCTKPCTQHEDCASPLRCTTGDPGESNGCF